mmetsp:Transcript_10539/g.17176  ORF Transcript_10539/g.17176 Transcript_10539/m.17176 type:complete len:107 (-) Transcript_10539:166-486(-)
MSHSKSLFKIVNGLRYFGVGAKVKRDIFKFPETYWVVTKVNLSKDQNHGKIHGRLVWRGLPKPKDEEISTALKRQWQLVELPDYASFDGSAESISRRIPESSMRTI